jgi:glycosyltransferase involved in cell wall biosynthesis
MSTSAVPAISVVLATFNRGALLGPAIRKLLALDPASPLHEIIVVDNRSTDDTRQVVEGLIPDSGGRLRYEYEAAQGVSYARNTGVAAARAPIVAFTDDDVRVSPDWLIALARAFDVHTEASYVGGRVLPLWSSPPPAWLSAAHYSPLALVDYGEGRRITTDDFRCVVTANFACRRQAFGRVGGFDPRLQHEPGAVSAIEDHELQVRLLHAGYVGWYEPNAVVHAAVQPERMRRAYHRRWKMDHGRALARMTPANHSFDGACTMHRFPENPRTFVGVPLFLFRELTEAVGRCAVHLLRGRRERAFDEELFARERAGIIHYYLTHRRRAGQEAESPTASPALHRRADGTG